MKRLGVLAATAASLAALAGCGVPAGGLIGVTVDAGGNPWVVVQMCEGHIDGATLYLPDDNPDHETPKPEVIGDWEVSPPVTGFSQFRLDDGGNGWRVAGALKPRNPATRYTIYGWSRDNKWSASHLSFSEQDLKALQPGTVLAPSLDPESDDNETRSLADFQSKTCDEWF